MSRNEIYAILDNPKVTILNEDRELLLDIDYDYEVSKLTLEDGNVIIIVRVQASTLKEDELLSKDLTIEMSYNVRDVMRGHNGHRLEGFKLMRLKGICDRKCAGELAEKVLVFSNRDYIMSPLFLYMVSNGADIQGYTEFDGE